MTTWRGALMGRLSSFDAYWGVRPQKSALPALVVTVISDDRPQTLKDYDLAPGRVQFDTYGATPEDAWDLAEQIISTLVPGGNHDGHTFSRADITLGPRDLIEDIGSTTVFRVSMDLLFYHTEAMPSS